MEVGKVFFSLSHSGGLLPGNLLPELPECELQQILLTPDPVVVEDLLFNCERFQL